jgi:integrase/recombinase XerD
VRYRINDQVVLLRMPEKGPEGPFAAYLGAFADSLSLQGYSAHHLRREVMLAALFSQWLKQSATASCDFRPEHSSRFLRYRYRRRRANPHDPRALSHFIEFLRCKHVIPASKISIRQLTPAERCARAYERYLREDRVLAEATIINYVPFIEEFLKDRFTDGQAKLSQLTARDVVRFVQRQAPRLHVKRAKLMTTALRSFCQYACLRGEVTLDLAAAVPIVANWSMTSIPRAIAPAQIRQLLASIDRHTAMGRRDYAIILLLARLGLRSGEVVSLELNDIDWTAGRLSVRGKRGQRSEMPIPTDVGQAIAAYLRHARPHSTSSRVFLRIKAPICGFGGSCGIGSIVHHRLQRAGIDAPTHGAHQFRHGLATEMLRQGASLAEIGAVLGHRHPDTTRIYSKVDLKALHTLAQPWPDGVR